MVGRVVVKTFVQELAGWMKKHHLGAATEFLESALESEVEGSRKLPTRDKIIKEAALNVADSIAFKLFQGPEFENWAGTLFEKIGQQASSAAREGVLELHRFRIEASDGLEVVGRYVGDQQDPDTEVPRHLSDDQLRRRFQALGAKPNWVEWSIRMVDTSTGRDLFSVYDFRVGIPLKTLVFEIFGKAALEAAADKALSKSSVQGAAESKRPAHSTRTGTAAKKKSAAQLDREIAEVVTKSKLLRR